MQNIRSHNGIPRRPALARAATQRYIGARILRSYVPLRLRPERKCGREGYCCSGG